MQPRFKKKSSYSDILVQVKKTDEIDSLTSHQHRQPGCTVSAVTLGLCNERCFSWDETQSKTMPTQRLHDSKQKDSI